MSKNIRKTSLLLLTMLLCSCNGNSNNTKPNEEEEIDGCVVTFNSNGGESVERQIIKNNGPVKEPVGVTREPSEDCYYYLDYWYEDDDEETPYDFSASVSYNFTLNAHWVEYDKIHPTLLNSSGVDFGRDVDPYNGFQFPLENNLKQIPNTFETWVNLDKGLSNPEGVIISNEEAESFDGFLNTSHESFTGAGCWYENRRLNCAIVFYIDKSGHPALFRYNGDPYSIRNKKGSFRYIVEDVDLRNGVWTHIAFTTNIETGEVAFFLNGVKHSSITVPNMNDLYLRSTVCIGGDFSPCNRGYFKGKLFDLRLWDDVRTNEEISGNKDLYVPSTSQGLEANYLFERSLSSIKKLSDTTNVHNVRTIQVWKSLDDYEDPDYDYSFVILPDTQTLANSYKLNNIALSQHIVDNKENFNIQFVMNVGDIGNGIIYGTRDRNEWYNEFKNARAAADLLDEAEIPFSIAPGNHDYEEDQNQPASTKTGSKYRNTDLMNQYFPLSEKEAYPCYGGSFVEENGLETQENTYFLLNIEGHKYLILNLELGPRDEVLEWANEVISSHSDYQVIAFSHAGVCCSVYDTDNRYCDLSQYWYISNPNEGDMIWNKCLKKHKNVIAFINGHYCGEKFGRRQDVGDNGNIVHSFMIDFTDTEFNRGGVEMFALMGFSNGGKTCTITARSAANNAIYLGEENIYTFTPGEQAKLPTLLTAPQGKEVFQTGNPVEIVTDGTCKNGKIVYRAGTSGEFSNTLRETDSGAYNIQYMIKGDEGYADTPILGTIKSKVKRVNDSGVTGWDVTYSPHGTLSNVIDGVKFDNMGGIGDRIVKEEKVHVDGLSFTCTVKGITNSDIRGWYLHNGSENADYYTDTNSVVWSYCGLYGQIRCLLGRTHESGSSICYKDMSTESTSGLGKNNNMVVNSIGDSNMTNSFTFTKMNDDWYMLTYTGIRNRADYNNYNISDDTGYTYIPASSIPMDENGDAYFAVFNRQSSGTSSVLEITNLE